MDETTYLYMVYSHGYFKIGISQNLKNRLSSFQSASPFPIMLLDKISIKDRKIAREFEHHIHNRLSDWNTHGEWFWFDLDAVECLNNVLNEAGLDRRYIISGDGPEELFVCISSDGVKKLADMIVNDRDEDSKSIVVDLNNYLGFD